MNIMANFKTFKPTATSKSPLDVWGVVDNPVIKTKIPTLGIQKKGANATTDNLLVDRPFMPIADLRKTNPNSSSAITGPKPPNLGSVIGTTPQNPVLPTSTTPNLRSTIGAPEYGAGSPIAPVRYSNATEEIITIGNKQFPKSYVQDPSHADEISAAIAGAGSKVYITDTSGQSINPVGDVIDPTKIDWANYHPTQTGIQTGTQAETQTGTSSPTPEPPPNYDIQGAIKQLAEAQLQASIAGLDKQKFGALSNLSEEKAKIQPAAIADRNNANISMNNTNKAWSDFLASRGLRQSGSASLGTGLNQAQYLGNIGSINRDATNKEYDVNRRVTDVNNNYLSDVESTRANINAQSLQNLISQMNTDRGFEYQVRRDTVGDNQWNTTRNDNMTQQQVINSQNTAQLTGTYNGNATLAKQQMDLDNQYRNDSFNWQKQTDLWNQAFQNNQFDYQKLRDSVADKQWGKQYQQQLDEFTWSKNAKNPSVRAQILDNQMKEIDVKNYSDQVKSQLLLLKQQISANSIKMETARTSINNIKSGRNSDGSTVAKSTVTATQYKYSLDDYSRSLTDATYDGGKGYSSAGVPYIADMLGKIDSLAVPQSQKDEYARLYTGRSFDDAMMVLNYSNGNAALSKMDKNEAADYLNRNSSKIKANCGDYYFGILYDRYMR